MDYTSIYNHVFVRNMSVEQSVLLWFQYRGDESYDIYVKEQKESGKAVENKWRTQKSKMKKLIGIMTQIDEMNNEKTSLLPLHLCPNKNMTKWKEDLKIVIKSCVDKMKKILIEKNCIKKETELTRNMIVTHSKILIETLDLETKTSQK